MKDFHTILVLKEYGLSISSLTLDRGKNSEVFITVYAPPLSNKKFFGEVDNYKNHF